MSDTSRNVDGIKSATNIDESDNKKCLIVKKEVNTSDKCGEAFHGTHAFSKCK